jgi:precorrin-2 dehydrogenase/sirohydrochlorin ferrochelatase
MEEAYDLYPVYLDCRAKACLVVGGGNVAGRKVQGLLRAGARVCVVSPEAVEPIKELSGVGRLVWAKRPYTAEDLEGVFFVVAASNIKELNQRVAAEARSRGILVNTAEGASGGDVFLPVSLAFKNLRVAVSSSGKCPAFAKALADVLGAWLGRGFPLALEVLTALREAHLRSGVGQERFVVEPSLAVTLSELLAQGCTHEARGILEKAYPHLLLMIPAALGRAA